MKPLRYFAAALAWVTSLAVAAAAPPPPPASLTIAAEQGQPFGLVLDGRALTWPMARQVRTGPLPAGWHRADVSVAAPFGPPVRFSTQVWLEPGRDNGYVVVLRRSGPQLRPIMPADPGYNGQYPPVGGPAMPAYPGGTYPAGPLPGTTTPGTYPNIPLPGNGNYPGTQNPGAGTYPGTATPGNYPGNNGYPTPGGSYPNAPAQPGAGTYPNSGYPNGGYNAPDPTGGYYPDGGPYLQPLAPTDLARLRQSVSQRPFDDDRLAIIKQALSASALPADELTALVRLLSFDRSRIELAKYGYAHVSDPQNFYRVYDALQFSSSVREVQDALGLPR